MNKVEKISAEIKYHRGLPPNITNSEGNSGKNHSSTTGYVQNVQGMIPKKLYVTRKTTGSETIYLARRC